MREAFGAQTNRRLTRKGVRVRNIDYQSDALMAMFLKEKVDDVEIRRWDGDIGTISVRADKGAWLTVPACDDRWIGMSELQMWAELNQSDAPDQASINAEERARRDFLNSLNPDSFRHKQLAGLISLPKTADELEYETQRFMRYADTAERRRKAGRHRELLGDLDDTAPTDASPKISHVDPDTGPAEDQWPDDDYNTME